MVFMNTLPLPYQRLYAKINLDAIEHNIAIVRNKIPKDTKLLLVVKTDMARSFWLMNLNI